MFALVVVLTASFQAFVWEYKYILTEREKTLLKDSLNKLRRYRDLTEKWLSKELKKK